jgi:hypothetical protein
MDCPDAQMAMSAEFDGEEVPEELRAEAAAHCESCSECAGFRRALAKLSAIQPTSPAADLVARTTDAVTAAAAADTQAAEQAATGATPGVVASAPSKPAGRGHTWLWVGSGAALVAAALIVFAFVRLTGMPSAGSTASTSVLSGAGTQSSKAPAAAPAVPVSASAPPYVTLADFVYLVGDQIEVSSSQIATAGTVVSSMGASDTPTTLQAYSLVGQPGTIVVLRSDGSYVRCSAVVRVFQGTTYQLVDGTTIQNFGQWPSLPPSVSEPVSADGSPALTSAGTDNLGVTVFRLLGSAPQQGIAVAPGTPAGDPAGGNPGWTWWLPAPS